MNAKDFMIELQNQESPWLTLAKRLVLEDVARKAATEEVRHVQPQEIVQSTRTSIREV